MCVIYLNCISIYVIEIVDVFRFVLPTARNSTLHPYKRDVKSEWSCTSAPPLRRLSREVNTIPVRHSTCVVLP
jgi:hypothetical protein